MWSFHDFKIWMVSKMENKMGQKHYDDFVKILSGPGMNPFTMYSVRSLDMVSSGAAEVGEVLATMSKLGTNRSFDDMKEAWAKEWGSLAARLETRADEYAAKKHTAGAASAFLRASEYHRQSFFFMRDNLSDPRIVPSCERMQRCFQSYLEHAQLPLEAVSIPYESSYLVGYFARGHGSSPGERRPIVVHLGDYDGCAEEQWLSTGRHAWACGYHVLVFDGPGQGSSLWCKGLYFPSNPAVVMDSVAAWLAKNKHEADLSRVVLIGRKYGGYLAAHTATVAASRSGPTDYKVAALAVAPLYVDMGARSIPGILSPKAQAMFAEQQDDQVNELLLKDMSISAYVRFSVRSRAGCHGFADTPVAWLRRYQAELTCESGLGDITCPVWAAMHSDKTWNHQVLDDVGFNKIKDLTVEKFCLEEDGTLAVYWEGGGSSTMERMMDWVQDKVPVTV